MRKILKNGLALVPTALVLSFVLLFFGYLRPEYDLMLHVDNVEGEGIVTATLCSPQPFTPFYDAQSYFGSELKSLTVAGIHYDVQHLQLVISGVKSMEADSYDIYFHGLHVGHTEPEARFTQGAFPGMTLSLTEDGQRVHFDFDDPDAGTTVSVGTLTVPAVGFCIPQRIFSMVDLPAPFFPTRAIRSRSLMTKLASANSGLTPNSTFSPSTDTIAAYFLLSTNS